MNHRLGELCAPFGFENSESVITWVTNHPSLSGTVPNLKLKPSDSNTPQSWATFHIIPLWHQYKKGEREEGGRGRKKRREIRSELSVFMCVSFVCDFTRPVSKHIYEPLFTWYVIATLQLSTHLGKPALHRSLKIIYQPPSPVSCSPTRCFEKVCWVWISFLFFPFWL